MVQRIFYVSGGGANLIETHRHWINGEDNPNETSITYSGQVASFISKIGANGYFVSAHIKSEYFEHQNFIIEHMPKVARSGVLWHLQEISWTMKILSRARRFRATCAIVDSGAIPFWAVRLFRVAGIAVIPVLHNTIWPHGFRPVSGVKRLISLLDAGFFRNDPIAAIAVSPEAARQIDQLAPTRRPYPVRVALAQFHPDYFRAIPPPPEWSQPKFEVMFVGRITRTKGVFDILEMARICEARLPGRVKWTICGRGPDLEALRATAASHGLNELVDIRGWTSVPDMLTVYGKSHASIIPTRSSFEEGMAMTAIEAILAGRPIVTNPVVPAHEVLAPAVALGRTNDAASHAEAVITLASERMTYEALKNSCSALASSFYDRRNGLEAVLCSLVTECVHFRT